MHFFLTKEVVQLNFLEMTYILINSSYSGGLDGYETKGRSADSEQNERQNLPGFRPRLALRLSLKPEAGREGRRPSIPPRPDIQEPGRAVWLSRRAAKVRD